MSCKNFLNLENIKKKNKKNSKHWFCAIYCELYVYCINAHVHVRKKLSVAIQKFYKKLLLIFI